MPRHTLLGAPLFVACTLGATGCGSSGSMPGAAPATMGTGGSSAGGTGGGAGGAGAFPDSGSTALVDFDPTASDFACITRGTKVRAFYIKSGLGKTDATLAVANSTTGGTYPVGTMIQLIPTEAMVKRKAGFSTTTNDWEFFSLTVAATGTTIVQRGTTDVVNQFNGNCFSCHEKAQPQFDLVCETDHGCDPLPLTPQIIDSLQQGDPRCP